MSKLHQKLHEIDTEKARLSSERERVCKQIHEAAVESARLKASQYKTTIQNGDYGFYNDASVVFVDHHGEIVMNGLKGTHTEIDMNNQDRESDFTKHGNIFEELRKS